MKNILKVLYQKGCIRDECQKICKRADLIDDLTQEVAVAMMEKPSKLIVRLYNEGKILGYIYKVAKYQYDSKTSNFYRKYKRNEKKNDRLNSETF